MYNVPFVPIDTTSRGSTSATAGASPALLLVAGPLFVLKLYSRVRSICWLPCHYSSLLASLYIIACGCCWRSHTSTIAYVAGHNNNNNLFILIMHYRFPDGYQYTSDLCFFVFCLQLLSQWLLRGTVRMPLMLLLFSDGIRKERFWGQSS